MRKIKFVLILVLICFPKSIFSQNIIADRGSFGVDKKNKIIVWHNPNLDSTSQGKRIII